MVNVIQQLEEQIALLQHEIAQLSDEIYYQQKEISNLTIEINNMKTISFIFVLIMLFLDFYNVKSSIFKLSTISLSSQY